MSRCLCLTQNGKQCARDAQQKSQFCWQHKSCKQSQSQLQSQSQPLSSLTKKLTPPHQPMEKIPIKKKTKKSIPLKKKMDPRGQIAYDYLKSNLSFFHTSVNERTDLCSAIEKNWVGKDYSNIGVGHVGIDWKTRQIKVYKGGREDIFVITLNFGSKVDHYNIFVEPDLTYVINSFDVNNPILFKKARQYLEDYINYYLTFTQDEFIQRQQKWFAEKPWEKLAGKTPEQAVEILKSQGWCS